MGSFGCPSSGADELGGQREGGDGVHVLVKLDGVEVIDGIEVVDGTEEVDGGAWPDLT